MEAIRRRELPVVAGLKVAGISTNHSFGRVINARRLADFKLEQAFRWLLPGRTKFLLLAESSQWRVSAV